MENVSAQLHLPNSYLSEEGDVGEIKSMKEEPGGLRTRKDMPLPLLL